MATVQASKKLFRSDYFFRWLPYKLTDQNLDKDIFIPFYAIKNAPVMGIIASVQSKLKFFLVFILLLL